MSTGEAASLVVSANGSLVKDGTPNPAFAIRSLDKRDWAVMAMLMVLALVMFLPGLGSFGILDPSEGFYSEISREMHESGNLVTPYRNYIPRLEKPILNYWLIALSYKSFGVSELTARIPAAASAILLVGYIYFLARHFVRRRAAVLSSLSLLSMPIFLVVGHVCLTDMPLSLLMSVAIGNLLIVWCGGSAGNLLPAYLCIGLALLCKGPIGLILPLAIVALQIATMGGIRKNIGAAITRLRLIPGVLLSLVVAVPWYVLVSIATHGAFLTEFFLRQNLARVSGTLDHQNPFWYFVPFVVGGMFPWSLILAATMPVARRSLPWKITGVRGCAGTGRSQLFSLGLIWSAFVFLLFSAIPSKLPTYILPMVPGVALITGLQMDTLTRLRGSRSWSWVGVVLTGATVAMGICLPAVFAKAPSVVHIMVTACMMLATALAGFTVLLYRGRRRAAICTLMASVIACSAILVPVGLNGYYLGHRQDFHQIIQHLFHTKDSIALLGPTADSAEFYLHCPVPEIGSRKELDAFIAGATGHFWLIVSRDRLRQLSWLDCPYKIVDHRRKWYLVSSERISPR